MSPQKKQAAKPIAARVSQKTSRNIPGKNSGKAHLASLKTAERKSSRSGKLSGETEEMIGAIGAGIYLTQKGKYVYVSSIYEALTGYAATDMIGKGFLNHVHPDDRAGVKKNSAKGMKGKNCEPYEYRFIHKNGEILWLLETVAPGVHKGAPAVQGSVMDITRYKQTREGALLSEKRYRAILEEISEGYGEMDLAGNFIFINQAGAQNIGYTPEEMIGTSYRDYTDAKSAQIMFDVYNTIYKTGKPVKRFEVEFVSKDGGRRIKEMSMALIRDEAGKPVGFRKFSRDITDLRQVEDELRKDEERYREILEAIDVGFCEFDLAGNITFVNLAGANLLGYAPEELMGTNFRRYINQSIVEQFLDVFKGIYKTGRPVKGFEAGYLNKDGIRCFVEISGALVRDASGKPVGFRGLARDITQRKWTEEALLQSEAKYRSIIESIGHAYFETDLRGMMTFFNDKISIDLGYTREELLRMSNRELQDAANAKKTYEVFKQVYVTGQSNPAYTYEIIRKDGTKAVFDISVSLIRDAQGNAIGFRGLSRDMTERKRMEDSLKASEARSRSIIAAIPDPYFESDLKGKITYINKAFHSLIGYSLDEIQSIPRSAYLDKGNQEAVFTLYNTVYTTELMMKNVEIEILTRSGEQRIVNLSVSLIRDNQGDPTGFQVIMRDATEKKKAEALIRESEQKLREYSESLERRVQERTTELEKSKVAAEAASRAKSDFLANISHEFQTPLNAIIGFSKVLKDRLFGELNDKQEEFVRYISEAGENLSKLLTEIIDVSSVSTGRTRLSLSAVSLPQVLSKTVQLLNAQIRDKQQTLSVNVAIDADVPIEADDEKVRHIFFHLLSNAVKYSPEGAKINIEAQRAKSLTGEEGVTVAFADNGPGIRPEDMPRLFQNFGRLESSYSRESSGIGVGLSLTRQLTELHGGSISAKSEYGHGSTFIVFLPLKQKHPESRG